MSSWRLVRWIRRRLIRRSSERLPTLCDPYALHATAAFSLGLVVEGGGDLVGVLFRVVKSQAADREVDDFMTAPRWRPG
jgi:hypothetical protein